MYMSVRNIRNIRSKCATLFVSSPPMSYITEICQRIYLRSKKACEYSLLVSRSSMGKHDSMHALRILYLALVSKYLKKKESQLSILTPVYTHVHAVWVTLYTLDCIFTTFFVWFMR